MSSKHLTLRFALIALCAFVFASCASKPQVDLSGVRNNPNAVRGGNGGDEFNGDNDFVEGPTDSFEANGGDGAGAVAGAGIGGGAWGSTDKPVAGTEDGNGFLKNASRWTDCVVYFSYDQSDVPASERGKLDTLAKYLNDNPDQGVIIEGHTDERGSDEYNRALGERRALAVQQYLALVGVADSRMQTISYGEDRPANATAQSESEHQLNRRAEFVIGDL